MPKLGIGKLMQASGSRHTEVAPHILVAAEVQLLDCPGAWLKTLAPDRKEEMLLQVDSARQKGQHCLSQAALCPPHAHCGSHAYRQ